MGRGKGREEEDEERKERGDRDGRPGQRERVHLTLSLPDLGYVSPCDGQPGPREKEGLNENWGRKDAKVRPAETAVDRKTRPAEFEVVLPPCPHANPPTSREARPARSLHRQSTPNIQSREMSAAEDAAFDHL